jgi:glutamate racemase
VLATAATVATTTYAELVDAHAAGIEVIACPAPGLVELVEQGILDGPQVEAMLARYLAPARAAAADTLVLGCTHYPFLRPVIERLMGPAITVIDTGAAVARQAVRVLMAHGLARPADMSSGQLALYTSGDIAAMRRALARLLPDPAFQPVWVEGVAG